MKALIYKVIFSLVLFGIAAQADPLERFGANAAQASMAGAGSVLETDYTALYACPSSMVFGRRSIGAGFMASFNRAQIRLSPRPAGYDPPDLGGLSPEVPYASRLHPRHGIDSTDNVTGLYLGGTVNVYTKRVKVGLMVFAPVSNLGALHTKFNNELEQFFSNSLDWELLGSRLSNMQVMAGVAVCALDWLALGASVRVMMSSNVDTSAYSPNLNTNYFVLKGNASSHAAAIASITVRPLPGWMMAVIFRDKEYTIVQGTSEIQVNGLQGTKDYPMYQKMKMVIGYSPRQVVFSMAYKRNKWGVALDVAWQQWSIYMDNNGDRAGFHNTFSPSVGGYVDVGMGFRLSGGFRYIPTPVPDQTGRTNYVDNNAVVLGLGLKKWFKLKGDHRRVCVSAFAQFQFLQPRSVEKKIPSPYQTCKPGVKGICDEVPDDLKDPQTGKRLPAAQGLQTGNPGFPGFSSGGWYGVAGLQVGWRY